MPGTRQEKTSSNLALLEVLKFRNVTSVTARLRINAV
ncbi:MAG: hypothetical protein JWL92_188 [Candidatus Nomurabacteria bacterium]|nr:hypothetical protein [Candidatus Nomurabacteria bacterium]